MTAQRSFPNRADSVTSARRYTLAHIGTVPDDVAELIAVMISEVATNCIRHAGTGFLVRIDRTPSEVRVAITDNGAGEPVVRTPSPTDPMGRGLRIVRALADRWGIVHANDARDKTVWFSLAVP
jgi:signal transduction histidine kinase